MTESILRPWVTALPIRHQGVLISASRGCDGVPKENSAKPLVRALRYAFMVPADEDEIGKPGAFMRIAFTELQLYTYLGDWDHYPMHFVTHLMGAFQVVGYCNSSSMTSTNFRHGYYAMVKKMHLMPESMEDMNRRLTEKRV